MKDSYTSTASTRDQRERYYDHQNRQDYASQQPPSPVTPTIRRQQNVSAYPSPAEEVDLPTLEAFGKESEPHILWFVFIV